MQAIAEGRFEDARALLSRLAAQEPEHAGAWLDLAILQCGLGHATEAEALFAVIELRFAPSAAIREVIAQQRASGCRPQQQPGSYQLRVGRGYDDNANQGARDLNLLIGDGAGGTVLALTPEYAPRGDAYLNLQAEGRVPLANNGMVGFGQVLVRRYDHLDPYNLSALSGGLEKPLSWGHWDARLAASVGLVGLGGRLYQTHAQWHVQLTPPLALPAGWRFALAAGQSLFEYRGQRVFDAWQTDGRAVLSYRYEGTMLQLASGPLLETGREQRPGGDRKGWSYSAGGRTPLWGKVQAEWQWSRFDWHGSRAYLPGLIDMRREQETEQLRLVLSYPVARQQAVVAEFRQVDHRENISIFSYRARQFSLNWQWQY